MLIIDCRNPSSGGLTVPRPPEDLRIEFWGNDSEPMSPVDVYLSGIEAIYDIANLYEWNASWPHRTSTFALRDRDNVWVRVERQLRRLETLHVVFGIYLVVIKMAETRAFYTYGADLHQLNRYIGSVVIEPREAPSSSSTSIDTVHYADTTNITAVDGPSQSPSLGRTIFFHGLTLTYTYAGGRVNSQDLFTAVLSGLLDAAKAGMDTVCVQMYATSWGRNLVLLIDANEGVAQLFTYGAATDILKELTLDMTLKQRRFAEINFVITNGTDELATGLIAKMPSQGNGTASEATSR